MKIYFEQCGGILGIDKKILIDTDYLNANEAFKLQQLIDNAKFFELITDSSEQPQRGADYFEYKITIKTREIEHHIKTTDITMPPNIGPLIRYLRQKALSQNR
jgi:hypothetical protein